METRQPTPVGLSANQNAPAGTKAVCLGYDKSASNVITIAVLSPEVR
jgi:hypothetical protein